MKQLDLIDCFQFPVENTHTFVCIDDKFLREEKA